MWQSDIRMEQVVEFQELIENKLQELFHTSSDSTLAPLQEMASYLLFAPAKRIRPLLVLVVADLFGVSPEVAVQPACALELIHTYSLIHDDLPCMDNDDMRRGKPSMHKVYGEATALLIGDFLLTHAFSVITQAPHLTSLQKNALIEILAKNAGGAGMVGGQWLELRNPTQRKEIYLKKTAALFVAAFQMGAVLATLPSTTYTVLTELGQQYGYLFQLIDDIEDNDYPESRESALLEIAHLEKEIGQLLNQIPPSPLLSALLEKVRR